MATPTRGLCVILAGAWLGFGPVSALSAEETALQVSVPSTFQNIRVGLTNYRSAQLRVNQDSNLVCIVAISGGGLRAANFAAGVLSGLEKIIDPQTHRSVLEEIDYFSTVSGGGLIVGGYLNELHKSIGKEYSFGATLSNKNSQLRKALHYSYQNNIPRQVLRLKAALTQLDRGDYIERDIDRELLGSRERGASLTLGDIFVPADQVHRHPRFPYWIANATIVDNGQIFQFTPDVFQRFQIIGFTHNLVKSTTHRDPYGVPLAVGAKASASFPSLIPATTLISDNQTGKKFIHLLDGGISDNLGISTAVDLALADDGLDPRGRIRKLIIVIDAYPGDALPFNEKESPPFVHEALLASALIPLDSWRGRYRNLFDWVTAFKGIQLVSLSFDQLLHEEYRSQNPELWKQLQDLQSDARMEKTRLAIQETAQDRLIEAGETVVRLCRVSLLEALRQTQRYRSP